MQSEKIGRWMMLMFVEKYVYTLGTLFIVIHGMMMIALCLRFFFMYRKFRLCATFTFIFMFQS